MRFTKREPFVPEPGTVIWRYFDADKFEDLLSTFSEHEQWSPQKPGTRTRYFNDPGQMWFSYPGAFEDEKEGHFPDTNEDPETYCDKMAVFMGLSEGEAKHRKERFLAAETAPLRDSAFFMAQMCGVSCWHANARESAEMWAFVAMKNGVAIRSTCRQVEHALAYAHNSPARRASPSVCAVGYVDYTDYFLPYDGWRGLLAIVQECYSYEHEVRFVAKSPILASIPTRIIVPGPIDPTTWTTENEQWRKVKSDYERNVAELVRATYFQQRDTLKTIRGFRLPVSLNSMISEVVLKPDCEKDYCDTVRDLLDQAACTGVLVSPSKFS